MVPPVEKTCRQVGIGWMIGSSEEGPRATSEGTILESRHLRKLQILLFGALRVGR